MDNDKFEFQRYLYYGLIGVISVVIVAFLPFMGSEMGLELDFPDSPAGWMVWIATKLSTAVLNVLIFHCFMQQAELNVQDNENYIEACEILKKGDEEEGYSPRSPKKWKAKQYKSKGVSIFITTAIASFSLTQAILTYDPVSLLTYLFTLVLGIIFGVLQMKSAEEYWCKEFWQYAKMIEKEKANAEDRRQNVQES